MDCIRNNDNDQISLILASYCLTDDIRPNKIVRRRNILGLCSNIVTIANCMIIPFSYQVRNASYWKKYSETPTKSIGLLLVYGLGCTIVGGIIAGIRPYASYIGVNTLLAYYNFKLFKKLILFLSKAYINLFNVK